MGKWAQLDDDAGKLWKAYAKRRSEGNRNKLVSHFAEFARRLAIQKYAKMPVGVQFEADDLASYAMIGLLNAVERFDPAKNCTFTTYAAARIAGAIVDGIREMDWVPRLERVRQKAGSVDIVGVCSLDAKRFDGGDAMDSRNTPSTMHEAVAARDESERSLRMESNDFWSKMLRSCNKVEKLVLLLYYREGLTMQAVGKQVALSESRVSQIHSRLIERFKDKFPKRSEMWE